MIDIFSSAFRIIVSHAGPIFDDPSLVLTFSLLPVLFPGLYSLCRSENRTVYFTPFVTGTTGNEFNRDKIVQFYAGQRY
jgi:hypothetical protein